MKRIGFIYLIISIIILITTQGCQQKSPISGSEANAVYYWRTTFTLSPYEREFLKQYNIKKMYVRFFDVVNHYEGNIPEGSMIFLDSVPDNIEIVPTIFISSSAIAQYDDFMEKMYQRVEAMAEVNGVDFHEIQIDCDWRSSGRDNYFKFMKEFRTFLKERNIKLSTTIRLFQLTDEYEVIEADGDEGYDFDDEETEKEHSTFNGKVEIPDADYGVLMCYNTGVVSNWDTENSILSAEDVKPYLSALKNYDLPLSLAFPTFSWDVEFNDEKYMLGLSYVQEDLKNNAKYKEISGNKYENLDAETDDYASYWSTKYIRREVVNASTILEVKEMILQNLASKPQQIIIYKLDSVDLSKFTKDEIENIYR